MLWDYNYIVHIQAFYLYKKMKRERSETSAEAKAQDKNILGPEDLKRVATCGKDLHTLGVGVLQLNALTAAKLQSIQREIDSEVTHFPEFLRTDRKRVGGGFGALGNPSSFHNPTVRKLRQWLHIYGVAVLKAYLEHLPLFESCPPSQKKWRVEQLIDRLLRREPGEKPNKESFHRDQTPEEMCEPNDHIFGGWFNFSKYAQQFVCVPGTHTGASTSTTNHSGFRPITKEDIPELKSKQQRINVPSGSIIFFSQHIAHAVNAVVVDYRVERLFVGWRLTQSDKPLVKTIAQQLSKQDVVTIKSGQKPHVWPKQYRATFLDGLETFSKAFKPLAIMWKTETVASGKNEGRVLHYVKQCLPSLEEMNPDWMYPTYTPSERALHTPSTEWSGLLKPWSDETLDVTIKFSD